MSIYKLTRLLILILIWVLSSAQMPPKLGDSSGNSVLGGGHVQSDIPTKRVIQYSHLSNRDVLYSKRIWRTIDLRQKHNYPLFYPTEPTDDDRMSLFDVIKWGALTEGSLTLYEPRLTSTGFDDQFRFPVIKDSGESQEEFDFRKRLLFGERLLIPVFNEDGTFKYDNEGNQLFMDTIEYYESRDIVKYEIKEDWFFDKVKSVMDVRIIGISPVVNFVDNTTGTVLGTKNLFWLYFPECRYTFQNFSVYNPNNDAMPMSFDDLFWKRDFNSYIHKESNVYDRTVDPTWMGVDALLESERIKKDQFKMEHDLWNL